MKVHLSSLESAHEQYCKCTCAFLHTMVTYSELLGLPNCMVSPQYIIQHQTLGIEVHVLSFLSAHCCGFG